MHSKVILYLAKKEVMTKINAEDYH